MFARRLLPLLISVTAVLTATPAVRAGDTMQLAGSGAVEYTLIHKFHKFVGRSKAMAVRGTVDASGLKAMARAQVGSFDSDNSNRDEHMMETVEGAKFPWVSVKIVEPGYKLPSGASTTKLKVQAAVELHGVTVNHPIDLSISTKDGTHLTVSFAFPESLTAHKIERPSLLFVPVDDIITVSGKAEVNVRP
jgi:hypothetical protein